MNDYVKLFLETAEKHADETAVTDRDGARKTDYRTLRDLVLKTASWIYSKKLDERSFIPVNLDSSAEYTAVVFGIWLSGHAAVPMGTSFPNERVRYISVNCDAPFIIDEKAVEEIKAAEYADISLFPDSSDDDAALLIYTSGSTGMPKGILHTFAGLLANRALGKPEEYSAGSQWALGAPMYFVASVVAYKVLTYGGCAHLLSPDLMRDVRGLEDYYEANGITIGFISPSVLSNFHNRAKTLRVVMTGSERLTGQCSRDGYKLFNNYGMSETMGRICSFLVDKPYDTTPVGIPNDSTPYVLLDENGKAVADGEEGELCVKGCFTVGYHKDPQATEKLFRDGWLHTGDIMKKLPDGNLVYINRKDWMVKINGQRVEPGEIENVLRAVDGVETAVVKAVKGRGDRVVLCAYYTGDKLEEDHIREELSKKLATYMIPSFYTHLEKMPLNRNGKVDRKNLPEPDIMSRRAEYAPPTNETEAILCRAFESALGAEKAGIDDDFFAMGGDSIRVMKLLTLCPGLDLTSKLIYSAKTPRAIAGECIKRGSVRERVKKERYPLSSSQQGIYAESMSRDGEAAYNNPILLKLGDSIDTERLCRACEAVVEAHPFIKTRISTDENGDAVQLRNDSESYSQTVERMSEDRFRALIPTLMQPFRLLSDRLFRIRIFETGEGKYLFMDLHHIIFDGSSMLIIMKDLEKAYNGEAPEKETYSGFEAAEDEYERRKTEYATAEKWYLDTFGGIEADSLPVPDRNEGVRAFGLVESPLAVEVSAAEDLCRRYGVTENTYATAAFGICMALYSGTNEALFTTIYNGRDSLRTAGTVAMLVKTLPVYSHFDRDTYVRDYLLEQKEQMLGCMNNDIYPFADLVAKTGITSDLLFVFQGDLLDVGGLCGEPVKRIPLMDNATGEQFAVQMYKKDGSYTLRTEYRSDLYSPEFVKIFVRSFENVLAAMLSAEKISDITLTSHKELETLRRINMTEAEYDRTQTVVYMFSRAAAAYPDNTAVIFGDTSLTYAETERRSDSIAAYIQSKGLGHGDVVSILIPKGIYQVIASLGALKAGCAYQPLDPTYPPERLNFMIKDSSAKLLITVPELSDLISGFDGDRLTTAETEKLPDKKPSAVCSPEDTFILLYTSGSTGVPKGVKLSHANLVCFIEWYRKFYEVTESDRISQYASYGFDACMMDMYPALCSGAAVVIVEEDMRLDLNRLNEYYIKNRVTLSFMTTQVGRQFAAEMQNPYIHAVSVGGEKLASMDPPKGFKLYNAYGPTECTIFSTIEQVTKKEDNIPIGRPLDNMKVYVVDPFGHQVPPGALGELILAGPQVCSGYLDRPEKTAEVFIKNPFDSGEFSSAYKTGDIVRFRTDGKIEFIGRRDGQVKIHGFRIELSEIEAVIREYSGVKNAAVVARDLGADGKAVAAYFVSDEKIDPKAIANHIRSRKPPYMVPASIMQIDSIPLNQNGKVNKKALPEPVIAAPAEETEHSDNILEAELRKIVGEAVNTERPPLSVPLEYLGLNSLGMIRLSTRLEKRFGVNIPVKGLKDLTIAGIEDIIIGEWMNGSRKEADTSAEETASMELSAAQTGIYIDCMRSPDSTMYNIPYELTFDRDMDTERLAAAAKRVLKAHPSMFVHFEIVDDKVMAVRDELKVPEINITELTEEKYSIYRERSVVPFKLNVFPLFRFAVIKTEKAVRLLCDLHHLIFDGFSMSLFLRDLETALKTDSAPESESASYFTYVREQKAMLAGKAGEAYEQYFGNLFADLDSSSELTSDVSGNGNGKRCLTYGGYDEERVKRACVRTGVSEPALLLAALDFTIARMTASDKVFISTISSGRSDTRFADTVGMFVNTVPLAAKLSHGTTDDFVKEVSEGLDDALSHENYPFANVAAKWGFTVNIMYEYQRGILEKPDIPHLVSINGLAAEETKFGLAVRIIDKNGKAAIEVEYNDGTYSESYINDFIRSYAIAIEKFSRRGDEKLRSVTLLDPDREELLARFHKRPVAPDISENTLFHSGVERFAAEAPDRTALIAADGTYTYRQLDENANRVANALISRGVKKGDRVVLLLPRTSRMFFSVFGVLKSGAAYIPCDPNYPSERIKHIIDDSHAALVITTGDRLSRFTDRPAEDVEALLAQENTSRPDVEITQDDLCYLIYTSGSTGKPKGVMIRHGGAVNYVSDTAGNILVNAMREKGHVLTAITTFSFDFSVKEWAMPLFNGLTVSVAADDEINDAQKLAARITGTDTDMFGSTPSRLMTLLASPEFSSAFENVRIVICGGEKYPEQLLAALKHGHDDRMIFNTYGPTETTVSCNTAELSEQDSVNVGRPLPGVTEYIVDTDGNELPAGIVGELYIGGAGVAAGYNGLPEMTAERFISYKGERVYKSGDYARWTAEGYIEVLGRKDNQIKLRGLRIELDEVDAVLGAVEGIKRTAVKIEKLNGIEHLCAWFTADRRVDIGELKKELGKTLTNYMVPTAYMQLDEMPFTPNGKLDLKALPLPELYRADKGEGAATGAEKIFCDIFSELLHVDDVAANENFFDLGGTSLLVTNIVIEAGKKGLKITFSDVFDNPTPRALAALTGENAAIDPAQNEDPEITGFDYTAVNQLLSRNTLDSFKKGEVHPLGNILLTGAVGYLGIHILHELIENGDRESRIYCLLRSRKDAPAYVRLPGMYYYYFDKHISDIIGERLFIIDGDVTDPAVLESLEDKQIDTVINCAAVVKHFSAGTAIEDVNVGGALNLIGFCLKTKAALVQTSTMSVLNEAYEDDIPEGLMAEEKMLYVGQLMSNKYIRSKFLAERAVLDAVANKGLRGKIVRLGNLAARYSDGEFQINSGTNSSMGRLKAFAMLGCASYDRLDNTMEFSPIDAVARAIVLLAGTPDDCTVFHAFNNQNIMMENVFRELTKLGYPIKYVESGEFEKAFAKSQNDPEKASVLTSIMAYIPASGGKKHIRLPRKCEYTMQVLYRLGFSWPVTTWDYIGRFVSALSGLGFFEDKAGQQ